MTRDRSAKMRSGSIAVQVAPEMSAPTLSIDVSALLDIPIPPCSRNYLLAKRALDVAVSLILLIVLSPLFVLVALLVRCTSRGPILFQQMRVGEGGRLFVMYKFRSMYRDVDDSLHQLAYQRFLRGQGGNGKVGKDTLASAAVTARHPTAVSLPGSLEHVGRALRRVRALLRIEDPRITLVGALLRATSVDELPQLINVLIGDMSLVGPRPPIPYEVRLYRRKHFQRLSVRPGLTGYWQVYGRNRVPFEDMVNMDLAYIHQRTFWLDLKLIIRTPIAMLHAHGAR